MFATALDALGIPWEYERDQFSWNPAPPKPKKYTPDFLLTKKDGSGTIYLEYKGYLRNSFEKQKMVAMKKQHPELDIRFVFEKANKPMSGSQKRKDGTRQTHGEWATLNDFDWMEFNPRGKKTLEECIPPNWLEEIYI